MRLVNIEPCEKLGHAMVLYSTEGGMLVQIRSCDMPTIDAVPVVRCKDCKKRNTKKCPLVTACIDIVDGEVVEVIDQKRVGEDFWCKDGVDDEES